MCKGPEVERACDVESNEGWLGRSELRGVVPVGLQRTAGPGNTGSYFF